MRDGQAVHRVKSWRRYCTGGRREVLAVSRRLPRNPRDMNDIVGVPPISPLRQPARPKPTPGRWGPSDELELRGDFDAAADALGNRAAARLERMRSLPRLALVHRAAGEVIANV